MQIVIDDEATDPEYRDEVRAALAILDSAPQAAFWIAIRAGVSSVQVLAQFPDHAIGVVDTLLSKASRYQRYAAAGTLRTFGWA